MDNEKYDPLPLIEQAEAASKEGMDAYYLFCNQMGYCNFMKMKHEGFHENFKQAAESADREKENGPT